MTDKRQEIRDWLASELQRKGHGAKGKLAEYLGIRADGVSRMLSEKGKEGREIKGDELVKMGEFFGTVPPGIDLKPISTKVESMLHVRGKVAASAWIDVEEMDFGYDDMQPVPSVSMYPAEWQFALEVEGNCLNKRADDGDILICLDIIKAQEDFKEGDLVVVERRKYGGQMVQRTAKRVRKTANGYELWPESTDPAHQDPIVLYEASPGETVSVIGRVLWIFRKP